MLFTRVSTGKKFFMEKKCFLRSIDGYLSQNKSSWSYESFCTNILFFFKKKHEIRLHDQSFCYVLQPEGCCDTDCCTHFWCHDCALCQERSFWLGHSSLPISCCLVLPFQESRQLLQFQAGAPGAVAMGVPVGAPVGTAVQAQPGYNNPPPPK